ncbi:hypothetical protein LguiB_002073 [Lonicera macranthoides]
MIGPQWASWQILSWIEQKEELEGNEVNVKGIKGYRKGNLCRYLMEFKGGIEWKEFVDQSLEAYQVCGSFVECVLLELDQNKVLHLLESPEALKAKVAEAIVFLRNVSNSPSSDQLVALLLCDDGGFVS